jgi:Xaa-Pro aminopeptidase
MPTGAAKKLEDLRAKMVGYGLDAYIIPSEDEHQSEYVANYDKRRGWISGFDGSAGVAVVTLSKAALWTDSRYFIRAEEELDHDYWILQKSGEPGVPSIENWLISVLEPNSKVGQSAKLTSICNYILIIIS